MANVTVKRVLRKDKMRKDGTAPIWLRITANRRSRYIATGIRVEPKYWNAGKEEIRGTHELADTWNDEIRRQFVEASEEALRASSAEEVKLAVKGIAGSLTAYFQEYIDALDESGQFWEWKKYRVTLGKLKECFGESIAFEEIDVPALEKFERFCRHKKKNAVNTTRKELGRVRRVLRQAEKHGRIDKNPFRLYDLPKRQQPNRRKLTFETIGKLKELDLDGYTALARDVFVFAFYARGMRFGDVCCLRRENVRDGRLEYTMMKTGQKVRGKLPTPAQAIAERYRSESPYVFPFLEKGDEIDGVHLRRRINSNNVMVNEALKDVAKAAEIKAEGFSMHVARHSYADFARRKSGNTHAIMESLGHTSLQVTQQYLKSLDKDASDELDNQLWSDA